MLIPYMLGTLFVIICLLLIVVVLLQKGRGGGLGAAFGGAGSGAFGTRIGDVFTWVTIVLTAMFLLLAIGTQLYFRPKAEQVARPQFGVPAGQVMTEPANIQIGSHTLNAEIRYTLDGAEPTKESKAYEDSPVRVTPGTTIKARAYRAGFPPSEIAVFTYGPSATSEPSASSEPAEASQPTSRAAEKAPASAPAP